MYWNAISVITIYVRKKDNENYPRLQSSNSEQGLIRNVINFL